MTNENGQDGAVSPRQENEQRFQYLLNATPDAVLVHDLDGQFICCNDVFCASYGYTRDELRVIRPWDIAGIVNYEPMVAHWREMVPGEPTLVEVLNRRKDNSMFPAEVRLVGIRVGEQGRIVAFSRDLTSQKRAEEAIRAQERDRLAHEIHDTLASDLTAIAVQLEAARNVVAPQPHEAAVHVEAALRLAREGLRETRRLLRLLRSEIRETSDLDEVLRQFVGIRSSGRTERFQFILQGRPYPLAGGMESLLLRVGQEAITNAMKHAHAREISVILAYNPSLISLHIQDDGQGCDLERLGRPGEGMGVRGMMERVDQIGGTLFLRSAPGCGTILTVTVPVRHSQRGNAVER